MVLKKSIEEVPESEGRRDVEEITVKDSVEEINEEKEEMAEGIVEDVAEETAEEVNQNSDDSNVKNERNEDDYIHSLSSIGSAATIREENESAQSDDEYDHQDTICNLTKMRRNSVSTTNLPNDFTGSTRSIYTSIVLMPESGAKWNQLAQRDAISKFCVIPVLEEQVGPKMNITDDLDDLPEPASTDSSLESNNPLRTLLARRAVAMSSSDLSPIAEMPFGSAVDINQSMRDVRKAKCFGQVLPAKATLRRNFLLQCLSFFFVYTGYVPIRGMQTSLNHHQNLGSISVSVIFGSSVLGSLICPILVQRYGAKRTLCLSMIGFLVYAVGNLYSSFYTLIPASIVFGIGFSCLLGAQGAYQTNLAAAYSTVTQTKIEKILPFFGGIYFTFLQLANIVGNGLASTVLKVLGPMIDPAFYLKHSANTTLENETVIVYDDDEEGHCGAAFDNVIVDAANIHVSPKALYTLLGIMIVLILISMTLCTFFVDRLDCIFKRRNKSLWSHLKTVFSYHRDFKTWLLLCSAIYSSFSPSLLYGDIVKAFVTCPIGLEMIGYAIVCYAAGSATMAFSSPHIAKLIGPKLLQYAGFLLSACLYTTMLLWQPEPDKPYLIFVLFGCQGMNDAVYQTRYYSLVGTIFAGKTETAYSFFLMYQSMVGALVFALSPLLPMSLKLYLGLGLMGLTCAAHTTLLLVLRKERMDIKEVAV